MGSKENDIWAKNMLENNRRKLGHASENRSSPNWPFFWTLFWDLEKRVKFACFETQNFSRAWGDFMAQKTHFWDLVLRPLFRRWKKWSIYHWFIVTFESGVVKPDTGFSGPPRTWDSDPGFEKPEMGWYFDPRACRFQPVLGSKSWGGFFILPSGSTRNSRNSRNPFFELCDFYG